MLLGSTTDLRKHFAALMAGEETPGWRPSVGGNFKRLLDSDAVA